MVKQEAGQAPAAEADGGAPPQPMWCTAFLIGVNLVLMGASAASFGEGPYSSTGQELWYRWGSLAFLVGGAIVPGVAAVRWARRSFVKLAVVTGWMFVALMAWCAFVLRAGGGGI